MKALLLGSSLLLSTLLPAAEFQFGHRLLNVPDGFVVEQVAGPPLVDRPIMGDFDEQGRLYVADSAGTSDRVQTQLETKPHRIVRLEDTDGDGRFDKSVVFADHMMFPEGILWFDGSIYCGAPPSIWRLTDTDGDGIADERTEWFEGKTLTGCANDLHGPYLGPDGWLYWCKGAFAEQTHQRPGRSPISDSAAHIFRCRADGSAFDAVMSGGMDNPVEVAFTPGGDLIFTTTFYTHPGGGERDALVHAVYGGVYPKSHGVLDGLIRTGELMPALTHLGPAVPCGLIRYESTVLEGFHNNLFSCQFNLHKVQRHILEPQGATYRTRDFDFLTCDHPDFHPTDVLEDADGSLLIVDTGGWYKICCPSSQIAKPDVLGAIFRVSKKGAPPLADPRGLALSWKDPAAVAARLDDPRPFVRRRAIAELAKSKTLPLGNPNASTLERLNRVWTLTRIDTPEARQAIRTALADGDPEVRQAAIHAAGLYRDSQAAPALIRILESETPQLQRSAATSLAQIGDRNATPSLLRAAARNIDRFHEHAIIYALIEIGDRQALEVGLTSEDAHTHRAALVALDQLNSLQADQVTPLLAAANPFLRETAGWIAGHRPEWAAALAGFFRTRLGQSMGEPELADLETQLSRFARTEVIQELMIAMLDSLPTASRRLVLRSMGRSGVSEVPLAWWDALQASLQDPELRGVAVTAIRSLPKPKQEAAAVSSALLRLAQDVAVPDTLRLDALEALPAPLSAPTASLYSFLISSLLADRPPLVRNAAAAILGRAALTGAQLDRLTETLRQSGSLEMPKLLEAYKQADDETLGRKLLVALEQSPGRTALRPDTLRPALEKMPQAVRDEGERLLERLHDQTAIQQTRLEELTASSQNGNPELGHALFNSAKTACATCHAIGYVGGKVGPDLSRIGAVRSIRDLLEAVVYPSANFVRSYEPMIVATRDGEEYSGILHYESSDRIRLVTGPGAEQQINKDAIVEIRPGTVSTMPEGLDQQLTEPELANLIAFLKSLR